MNLIIKLCIIILLAILSASLYLEQQEPADECYMPYDITTLPAGTWLITNHDYQYTHSSCFFGVLDKVEFLPNHHSLMYVHNPVTNVTMSFDEGYLQELDNTILQINTTYNNTNLSYQFQVMSDPQDTITHELYLQMLNESFLFENGKPFSYAQITILQNCTVPQQNI